MKQISLGHIFFDAGEDFKEIDYLFCGMREEVKTNTLHPCQQQKTITASDNIALAYQQVWADQALTTGWMDYKGQFTPYILFAPNTNISDLSHKGQIYQVAPNHFKAKGSNVHSRHVYTCTSPIKINKGHSFPARINTAMQAGLLILSLRKDSSYLRVKNIFDHENDIQDVTLRAFTLVHNDCLLFNNYIGEINDNA